MPTITNIPTSDGYSTNAVLQDIWNAPSGGWFSIFGNATIFQIQYGARGKSQWGLEQELGAGAYGSIPEAATGIRFRSAIPGNPAIISATITQANEPAISVSALGVITVPSLFGATQTVLVSPGGTFNGTYNTPANALAILIECIGGGAGGGGAVATGAGQGSIGGGGGGGAYASELVNNPAASYNFTIGGGGAGSSGNGGAGNPSSFGPIVSAGGGAGGSGDSGGAAPRHLGGGGAGGAGLLGSVLIPGNGGDTGLLPTIASNTYAMPMGGGAARGAGKIANFAALTLSGLNGLSPGGGGGGACTIAIGPGLNGGNGADGIIVVTEYY
jgi:hypothetical protein